jgi:hypothetical protein
MAMLLFALVVRTMLVEVARSMLAVNVIGPLLALPIRNVPAVIRSRLKSRRENLEGSV